MLKRMNWNVEQEIESSETQIVEMRALKWNLSKTTECYSDKNCINKMVDTVQDLFKNLANV